MLSQHSRTRSSIPLSRPSITYPRHSPLCLKEHSLPKIPQETEIPERDTSSTRSIAKALSWRTVATLDTIAISWIQTGSLHLGFKVGAAELATKTALFYLHDQVWNRFGPLPSKTTSLLRAISWRFVGTVDTMLVASLISGNLILGGKIAATEFATKVALFYFHERVWDKYLAKFRKKK